MKIKKLLIMLPIRNTYKSEKEAEKYKKSTLTIAILQVGIEVGCAHSICNLNHCTYTYKLIFITDGCFGKFFGTRVPTIMD